METKIEMENVKVSDENWLEAEKQKIERNSFDGEVKPNIKLEENQITTFEIDFSKEFQNWEDVENKSIKKIIPVTHEGEVKNFWLNVKNPVYKQIIELGSKGQTKFSIMRTGQAKGTRYNIVEEK